MSRQINYVELNVVTFVAGISQRSTGVLVGLIVDRKETFVGILKEVNSHLYCNINNYLIKGVKIQYVDGIEQNFFLDALDEQKEAIDLIKDTIIQLRVLGITDKEGGVDINKYSNDESKSISKKAQRGL